MSKICQIFRFLCQIRMDFPNNAKIISMERGGLVTFDQCKQSCTAKGFMDRSYLLFRAVHEFLFKPKLPNLSIKRALIIWTTQKSIWGKIFTNFILEEALIQLKKSKMKENSRATKMQVFVKREVQRKS